MSTSQILQHLYSLDTSSPGISRLIYGLIRHDEEEQYLSSLQGSELSQLIDFLDEVSILLSAFRQAMKQIIQALSAITTTDDVSRKCLRKLQAICGDNTTLPSSYTISGDLARVGDEPAAFGGFADVWEGTHSGKKVCIKALRVTLSDDPTLTKVSTVHLLSCPLKDNCGYRSHSSKRLSYGRDCGTQISSLSLALQRNPCKSCQNGCQTEL